MKHLKSPKIEWIVGLVILIFIGIFYIDITEYVNGSLEPTWAENGFDLTNYNLRFFFLYGFAAYGVWWIIHRYAKKNELLATIVLVSIAAAAMSILFFFYTIPMTVGIIIFIIKIKERKLNDKSSNNGVEGIYREDALPPSN